MNILLVSTQDYIHHPVPSRHHNIFERLAARHTVVVPHFHVSKSATRNTKLIVEECTMFPFTNPLLHYSTNFPHQYRRLNEIMMVYDIDVVCASNVLAGTAAIYAAKKNNVPVVFDLKDWFPVSATQYNNNRFLRKIIHDVVLRMTLWNLKHSKTVVTVSNGLQLKLKDYGIDSIVIPNGVSEKFINFKHDERLYEFTDRDFIVGFAGSIERWYELEKVIQWLSRLSPNIKLLIVGPSLFTKYKYTLEKQVRDNNMDARVVFVDGVEYERLPYYINMFDVCIAPLGNEGGWREYALPNKIFEYTACQKPVLATYMPDVAKLNLPNIFFYENYHEFAGIIHKLRREKPSFNIDVSPFYWNNRVSEFEHVLEAATLDK